MKQRRKDRERTPALVLVPATIAPLVLVGGWSLAASAQSDGYDPLNDTLSALAAVGASHREIMTWAFVLLGLAHLGTAALLRVASGRGRALLALGGLATVAVALFPLSDEREGYAHATAAVVAFGALALWSALAARADGPRVLRPRVMRGASVVLALLVALFAVTLVIGHLAGVSERVAALAEALWPLVVAWMVREWAGGGGTPPIDEPDESPTPDDERPDQDRPDQDRPDDRPSTDPSPDPLDKKVSAQSG